MITDDKKISYRSAFVEGTPGDTWDNYVKYEATPHMLTWENFKIVVFSKLGDLANPHQTLVEEYHSASQDSKESVQQFSARLDKFAEKAGKRVTDKDRAVRF